MHSRIYFSAAIWPAQQSHDIKPDVSNICFGCGEQPETPLHLFWECKCNASIDDDHVQNTQYLIEAACAKSVDQPCLWLRGILPDNNIYIPPHLEPTAISSITWDTRSNYFHLAPFMATPQEVLILHTLNLGE